MSSFVRQAAKTTTVVRRTFATSSVARKDLVQDLYLRELKSYKPKPTAKDAHVGVVKNYSTPSAPKPPTLPTDLSAELSAYDASNPVVDSAQLKNSAGTASASGEDDVGVGAEAFLSFLEKDIPKVEHHH